MTKRGGTFYNFLSTLVLCLMPREESVRGDAEALHFGEVLECSAGKEREGSIAYPFLYIGPCRRLEVSELEVAESSTCNQQKNRWRRIFNTNHHRWGRAWLYSKRRAGKGKRLPLAAEAPTRGARTRGLPLRLRCGPTLARLSPTPSSPGRGEKLRDTQVAWRPSSSSGHVS